MPGPRRDMPAPVRKRSRHQRCTAEESHYGIVPVFTTAVSAHPSRRAVGNYRRQHSPARPHGHMKFDVVCRPKPVLSLVPGTHDATPQRKAPSSSVRKIESGPEAVTVLTAFSGDPHLYPPDIRAPSAEDYLVFSFVKSASTNACRKSPHTTIATTATTTTLVTGRNRRTSANSCRKQTAEEPAPQAEVCRPSTDVLQHAVRPHCPADLTRSRHKQYAASTTQPRQQRHSHYAHIHLLDTLRPVESPGDQANGLIRQKPLRGLIS